MTAWVILVPTSKLYEKWFKDLPNEVFKNKLCLSIQIQKKKKKKSKRGPARVF
jgi:hypothetical protein